MGGCFSAVSYWGQPRRRNHGTPATSGSFAVGVARDRTTTTDVTPEDVAPEDVARLLARRRARLRAMDDTAPTTEEARR